MSFRLEIDPRKAEEAYHVIIEALREADLSRAEALVGLLTCVATQYYGGVLPAEKMAAFTKDCSEWLSAYFADRGPDHFRGSMTMHRKVR